MNEGATAPLRGVVRDGHTRQVLSYAMNQNGGQRSALRRLDRRPPANRLGGAHADTCTALTVHRLSLPSGTASQSRSGYSRLHRIAAARSLDQRHVRLGIVTEFSQ